MTLPTNSIPESQFYTDLPILVWGRPASGGDWQPLEGGPGIVHLPADQQIMVRLRTVNDASFEIWATAAQECKAIVAINLSENRKVTSESLEILAFFPQLIELNLSSCDLTTEGLQYLSNLSRLEKLDLSYCNRINDLSFKVIRTLPRLRELNLKGCARITHGGIARLRRPEVKILR
ncbi:MAG TPA: leucine-rich repeat domain-containing protein [Anaerolineaceae bacterium]|nr:leucine-rich repeat domain-containing protein [Anaerolineaceae bacterium]